MTKIFRNASFLFLTMASAVALAEGGHGVPAGDPPAESDVQPPAPAEGAPVLKLAFDPIHRLGVENIGSPFIAELIAKAEAVLKAKNESPESLDAVDLKTQVANFAKTAKGADLEARIAELATLKAQLSQLYLAKSFKGNVDRLDKDVATVALVLEVLEKEKADRTKAKKPKKKK